MWLSIKNFLWEEKKETWSYLEIVELKKINGAQHQNNSMNRIEDSECHECQQSRAHNGQGNDLHSAHVAHWPLKVDLTFDQSRCVIHSPVQTICSKIKFRSMNWALFAVWTVNLPVSLSVSNSTPCSVCMPFTRGRELGWWNVDLWPIFSLPDEVISFLQHF